MKALFQSLERFFASRKSSKRKCALRTNCTASAPRVRHTHTASPALPNPPRRGRAHLHSKCTTRQAHTHRAYETTLVLLSSPISDMLSHLTYPGRCHTPPRSSASCGSLAPRPLIFLVNAIVKDTLPRTGLLFAHKTQRTHPGGEGDGGGRTKLHGSAPRVRHTHTQQSPPSRPTRRGRCSPARQCTTRQAHTHTGPMKRPHILSSPISDMPSHLTSLAVATHPPAAPLRVGV